MLDSYSLVFKQRKGLLGHYTMQNDISLPLLTFSLLYSASIVGAEVTDEDVFLTFGDEEFVSIATGQQQSLADAPSVADVNCQLLANKFWNS